MNLDEIKVGQFVVVVLGADARTAQVTGLLNQRWPLVELKPWLTACRKPEQVSLGAVIFAGTEDDATAAASNYRAIKRLRSSAIARAQDHVADAQQSLNELREQVEAEAQLAAAGKVHA